MLRSSYIAGVLALMAPTLGLAQNAPVFEGSLFAGYSSGEIAGVDISAVQLGLESDIIFSPSFQLGFDIDLTQAEASAFGTTLDADFTRVGVEPRFNFANGFYAGAYYQMSDVDLGLSPIPLTLGLDYNSYGVFGGYDNGTWNVELYAGMSDTDPGLPAGVDIADYGISGSYQISPDFAVFGNYANTAIDIGGTNLDVNVIAIGGEYGFQNGLSVFGSVGQVGLNTPGPNLDATQIGLGLSYDLAAAGGNIPAIISFEVAHTDIDASAIGFTDSMTTWSVGVTVPLGGSRSTLPLNSSARLARGDVRSAVVSGLGGIF